MKEKYDYYHPIKITMIMKKIFNKIFNGGNKDDQRFQKQSFNEEKIFLKKFINIANFI